VSEIMVVANIFSDTATYPPTKFLMIQSENTAGRWSSLG